jgi:serine/threonine-protein kinase
MRVGPQRWSIGGLRLSPISGMHQVARPMTRLVPGDLDEFLDRWLGWFASASQSQLGYPSPLPEQPVQRVWRVEQASR